MVVLVYARKIKTDTKINVSVEVAENLLQKDGRKWI
jgi:hypothetical protein